MDMEKAGAALASGDLATFVAECDESVTFSAEHGSLVIGHAGHMVIEFMTDHGQGLLTAVQHADDTEAGACYAERVTIAREHMETVNRFAHYMNGDVHVTVSGGTDSESWPDYVPGSWSTP